jgi:hypothetical protein
MCPHLVMSRIIWFLWFLWFIVDLKLREGFKTFFEVLYSFLKYCYTVL